MLHRKYFNQQSVLVAVTVQLSRFISNTFELQFLQQPVPQQAQVGNEITEEKQ